MVENAPKSEAEHVALHIIAEGGHRFTYAGGMSGQIIGYDWTVILLLLKRSKHDEKIILPLLIAAEKAMIEAINKKDEHASS